MIEGLKIGVLIPTRGDERRQFVKNAIRLVGMQTVKPHRVEIIGDPPLSNDCDITYRYRTGYKNLSDCDIIFFWEDDDWYANDYIETMLTEWDKVGRPDLFGTRYTIYYNLRIKRYFTMYHEQRASAMNTMIKPNLNIAWGLDTNPFTDCQLWDSQPIRRKLFTPKRHIACGIKHGVGMSGGKGHTDNFNRYLNDDPEMHWLRKLVDDESFEFYKEINRQLTAVEL